jgi:hypothetical protein
MLSVLIDHQLRRQLSSGCRTDPSKFVVLDRSKLVDEYVLFYLEISLLSCYI